MFKKYLNKKDILIKLFKKKNIGLIKSILIINYTIL